MDPVDRDAVLANVAIKKKPVDYRVIVELACIRSPDELLAVKRAYQIRYKHSLEEDVAHHTTDDMRKVCGRWEFSSSNFNTIIQNLVVKSSCFSLESSRKCLKL